MNIKPIRKNILLAEQREKYVSDSGLIVESASAANSKVGVVLDVGSEVTEVNIGDKVLVEWTKGTIVMVDNAQRVVVNEDAIVAVLM